VIITGLAGYSAAYNHKMIIGASLRFLAIQTLVALLDNAVRCSKLSCLSHLVTTYWAANAFRLSAVQSIYENIWNA